MLIISILSLVTTTTALAFQPEQHPLLAQPAPAPAPAPVAAEPYRPLPWGQLNILSTTDTHGWLLGHRSPREPSYSGDWGDLYSFVQSLKRQAQTLGVDFLLVDSGDRVDGNGLVDGEPPEEGHVKGWTALSIFRKMPYDLLTTGNHELYRYPVALANFQRLVRWFGERYVTSNVKVRLPEDGRGERMTMRRRWRKWRTEQGRRVTALGVLFDFKAHAENVTVVPPHLLVLEPWFQEIIHERPDFFLLVGHMSIRSELDAEWQPILRAIRAQHPTTPVLIFGGHHHIRDCVQLDPYSMSLAAGRYMETVGFMSVSGLSSPTNQSQGELVFRRRYLDQNRATYAYHANTTDFDTATGREISKELKATAERFNLTWEFGVAPRSYYLTRHAPSHPASLLNLLTTKVLPSLVNSQRPDRGPGRSFTILNSGSVRFDLFQGPFTRNDQWIMLPFTNSFLYVPSVPRALARRLLPYLNLVGEHHLSSISSSLSSIAIATTTTSTDASPSRDKVLAEHHGRGLDLSSPQARAAWEEVVHRRRLAVAYTATSITSSTSSSSHAGLTPGYVTLDSCSSSPDEGDGENKGDDTLHSPIPAVTQPVFVGTEFPRGRWRIPEEEEEESENHDEEEQDDDDDDDGVDVVFFDFILPDIISALNVLSSQQQQQQQQEEEEGRGGRQRRKEWTKEDVGTYIDPARLTANTLMQEFARREWN